jgi:hypothetical protein
MNRKPVNEAAKALAKQVLEADANACAWCAPGGPPGTSHGICRRHFIEQMLEMGIPEDTVMGMVAKKDKAGDWCQDLGTDAPMGNEAILNTMEHIAYFGGADSPGPDDPGPPDPGKELPQDWQQKRLSDILSEEDIAKIMDLWNNASSPEEGMNRLRGFLTTRREELEANGVDPGYLAYYLYAVFTKTI